MSNSNQIFNVLEAEGTDRVALETTAAAAQIEAPTSSIAREVEVNADNTQEAAAEAALTAQIKGPSLTGTSAVDQLQWQAKQTTNAAVAEGQRDVEAAKVTSAGYLDQAKSLASSAINTAQGYLPTSVGGTSSTNNSTNQTPSTAGSIASSLQSGANTAIGTTKEYLATAQEMAKPHVENVKGVAQGYLGTAGIQPVSNTPASSTGIPATKAPLESGPHTVNTPYPSTTTASSTKVGENSLA